MNGSPNEFTTTSKSPVSLTVDNKNTIKLSNEDPDGANDTVDIIKRSLAWVACSVNIAAIRGPNGDRKIVALMYGCSGGVWSESKIPASDLVPRKVIQLYS